MEYYKIELQWLAWIECGMWRQCSRHHRSNASKRLWESGNRRPTQLLSCLLTLMAAYHVYHVGAVRLVAVAVASVDEDYDCISTSTCRPTSNTPRATDRPTDSRRKFHCTAVFCNAASRDRYRFSRLGRRGRRAAITKAGSEKFTLVRASALHVSATCKCRSAAQPRFR